MTDDNVTPSLADRFLQCARGAGLRDEFDGKPQRIFKAPEMQKAYQESRQEIVNLRKEEAAASLS